MIEYKSLSRKLKITVAEDDPGFNKAKIVSSDDAYKYAKQFYHDDVDIYESMFALFLNRANNVIAWAKISQGGTVGTVCDTIIVMKYAVDSLAKNIILCHNHPSGNATPSRQDDGITQKIYDACKFFDISLLDHIIIAGKTYYSYADEENIIIR